MSTSNSVAQVAFKRKDGELKETDHTTFKALLEHMFVTIGLTGEYTLQAAGAARQGGPYKKGVTVGPPKSFGVEVYYQPEKSKKQAVFHLLLNAEEGARVQEQLKLKFPKSVYSLPKQKPVAKPKQAPAAKAAAVPTEKSPFFIENFSAKNQEHARAFAKQAQQRAQAFADAVLPKKEVTDLLAQCMGLPKTFGVGPKLISLISQGVLIKFGDDAFLVKDDPKEWVTAKAYDKKTPKAQSKSAGSKLTLSDRLNEVYTDNTLMYLFFEQCMARFAHQEYVHASDLFELMRQTLKLDVTDQTLHVFVRYLIQAKKLEKGNKGWYRLTESMVGKVVARQSNGAPVTKIPKVQSEIAGLRLTGPMKQALENHDGLVEFARRFHELQGAALYLDNKQTHELIVEHLLPSGGSTWSFNQFQRALAAEGYLSRDGRSKFSLAEKGQNLLKEKGVSEVWVKPVQDAVSVSPAVTPVTTSDATVELLAKAVRTKRRLEDEVATARKRAAEAEAKRDALEARVVELEAKLRQQPDIEPLVKEGVAAELQRLLLED